MGRLKVDLHDIYSNGAAIEAALNDAIEQAVAKRLDYVEIILDNTETHASAIGTI